MKSAFVSRQLHFTFVRVTPTDGLIVDIGNPKRVNLVGGLCRLRAIQLNTEIFHIVTFIIVL